MRSHAKAPSAGSNWIATASALLLAFALLAVVCAPASAATGRSLLRTISTGPGSYPEGLTTDGAGNLYVLGLGGAKPGVAKIDSAGNPVPFGAAASYISGNLLTGTPDGSYAPYPGYGINVAVDSSGGPNDGYIYVANMFFGNGSVFVYDASGSFQGILDGKEFHYICGVSVNQADGAVYTGDTFSAGVIHRFAAPVGNPAEAVANGTLSGIASGCSLAVDSTGAAYVNSNGVSKFAASQFEAATPSGTVVDPDSSTALAVDPANDDLYIDKGDRIVQRTAAGTQVGAAFPTTPLSNSRGVTVDAAGNVYASESPGGDGGVFVFGPDEVDLPLATTGTASNVTSISADVAGEVDPDAAGPVTGCEFKYGRDAGYSEGSVPCSPAVSSGSPISGPTAVSGSLTGLEAGTHYHYRLFVTSANGVAVGADQAFDTPVAVEGVTTGAATGVTKDGADLHGSYVGGGLDTHYYFEYGLDAGYGQTAPAPPGNDAGSESGPQDVAAVHIAGLKGLTTYHYRLVASNSNGVTRGQDEALTTPEPVDNLSTDPVTSVTNSSADLHGSFDADKYDVDYFFEWGPTTNYGNSAPVPPGAGIPAGSGKVNVPAVGISGLQEGATYHYRIVATNETGKSVGADRSFKTAEPPTIANLATANVRATSAELTAEINPRYGNTTYHFEWGTTTAYGNLAPVPDGKAGSGNEPVLVGAELDELISGRIYHFRLVATNQYGTTTSVDQTFGFYPPACPNAQVRQETGSNDLPDCRGYELASPADADGTTIFPLNGPATGQATNPARIAYGAGFGVLPGTGDPINSVGDLYVSTRTDTGWFTKYIGRPANEALLMGKAPKGTIGGITQGQYPSKSQLGVQASLGLDRFINYDLGFPSNNVGQRGHPSNAPFVWDASTGGSLGRWPTNLASIEGGEDFVGTPMASPDFSHFVFSSNVPFAPGGEAFPDSIECCSEAGVEENMCCSAPIYDNDLVTGQVSLISIKEDEVTSFRGAPVAISTDGSRILMSENADVPAGIARPLFLRVNGTRTYDIAGGTPVKYVDSTADGKTIYISSTAQLTADDEDTSADLFMWKESAPDSLTRVSFGAGGSAGNSDDCSAAWTSKCDIKLIAPEDADGAGGLGGGSVSGQESGNGYSDMAVASEHGDIYFESPEQLAGAKGDPGEVNVYLYRDGTVRYVTTTNTQDVCSPGGFGEAQCVPGPLPRFQVTPSGSHAAFITAGQLTSYDNDGKGEMYTYTAATGRITCVSCRPDGEPPVTSVSASQNGLFLANDGRAFFSAIDPLVPRDTNEGNDVYEYVEGKPQLISAGTGQVLEAFSAFTGAQTVPGLVGVSANGTDVYFATYDILVTQDRNGAEIKIMDARVGGGFPAERQRPNCAAADECHGPGSAQPASPPDRTNAHLGTAKKQKAKQKKHKRQKKKQRQKSKKSKHKASKRAGGKHHG